MCKETGLVSAIDVCKGSIKFVILVGLSLCSLKLWCFGNGLGLAVERVTWCVPEESVEAGFGMVLETLMEASMKMIRKKNDGSR